MSISKDYISYAVTQTYFLSKTLAVWAYVSDKVCQSAVTLHFKTNQYGIHVKIMIILKNYNLFALQANLTSLFIFLSIFFQKALMKGNIIFCPGPLHQDNTPPAPGAHFVTKRTLGGFYSRIAVSCCLLFSVRGRDGFLASLFRKTFLGYFGHYLLNWGCLTVLLFTCLICAYFQLAFIFYTFFFVAFFRLRFSSALIKPCLLAFYLPGTSNNFCSVNGNVQWFLDLLFEKGISFDTLSDLRRKEKVVCAFCCLDPIFLC